MKDDEIKKLATDLVAAMDSRRPFAERVEMAAAAYTKLFFATQLEEARWWWEHRNDKVAPAVRMADLELAAKKRAQR